MNNKRKGDIIPDHKRREAIGAVGQEDLSRYDAVFHAFYGDDYVGLTDVQPEDIVLASGGYDNIYNKLVNSDEMPKVILRWQARYGDYTYETIYFHNASYQNDHVFLYGNTGYSTVRLVLDNDNTIQFSIDT